jgi:hypothetical protein
VDPSAVRAVAAVDDPVPPLAIGVTVELSYLLPIAVEIAVNSASISVPFTSLDGLPVRSESFAVKFVALV